MKLVLEKYLERRKIRGTRQLNQLYGNERITTPIQLRGSFACIDKRQRNFNVKLCLRNSRSHHLLVWLFVTIRQTSNGSFMIVASREQVVRESEMMNPRKKSAILIFYSSSFYDLL